MKTTFGFAVLIFFIGIEARAANPIAIPCLNASGAVVNASPNDVCKAMLPKCSELKDKMATELKDMLAWKIYGYYYLGKDIKLDAKSGMTSGGAIKGDPLPYPICSVVGHKISGPNSGANLAEIESQNIPNGKSCGSFPIFQHGDSWNYKTTIQYDSGAGTKWFSYVLGAYPWELRRNAYDVLKQLNPDLSNVHEVISTESMAQDVRDTLLMIKTATLALSADAKLTCSNPPSVNIVEACTSGTLAINDPIQKLCTLAKAQLALNNVAVTNMLVYEVMDRTKKMHEQHFGNIFNANANPHFAKLIAHCSDNRTLADKVAQWLSPIGSIIKNAIMANKSYACMTSCMTDGDPNWYVNNTNSGGDGKAWKNSGGNGQRKCGRKSKHNLLSGQPESTITSLFEPEGWTSWHWNSGGWWDGQAESTGTNQLISGAFGPMVSDNVGFAGMIESIIRRDICKQTGYLRTGASICDEVGIPDKPAGVQ